MAVLNKAWGSSEGISPKTAAVTSHGDEEEGAEEAERTILEKPMMIYVTDGASSGFDKVEKVVLMDDKVCIGMWAFDCVKMTPEHASADPLLADTGTDVPRFIFVSRDMKTIDVVDEKKMSAKNVFKTMKKHATKAYTTKFEKNVKECLKVLGEFDKINNAKRVLAEKEGRMEDSSKGELKKLEKEKAELEEREKEAQQKKEELLTFEPKEIKAV